MQPENPWNDPSAGNPLGVTPKKVVSPPPKANQPIPIEASEKKIELTAVDPTTLKFTLPQTNIFAPENGWLEYDPFLLGFGLFSGANR